jgi:hypothetical protein
VRAFKIERPIAFILILNTSAHTIGASIAGSQFDELWGDECILLFSLVFRFAILQFTVRRIRRGHIFDVTIQKQDLSPMV